MRYSIFFHISMNVCESSFAIQFGLHFCCCFLAVFRSNDFKKITKYFAIPCDIYFSVFFHEKIRYFIQIWSKYNINISFPYLNFICSFGLWIFETFYCWICAKKRIQPLKWYFHNIEDTRICVSIYRFEQLFTQPLAEVEISLQYSLIFF